MVIILQRSSFYPSSLSSSCYSRNKKERKEQKQFMQKQTPQETDSRKGANILPFKKPSPTPLLIRQKPINQTQLQALEAVVSELEASVENGIDINDTKIFASLLETCYKLKAINQGLRVHRLIPANLLRKNVGISSKLLRLYAFCGYTEAAHEVFDQMPRRKASAFAWNSLISGYAETGEYEDALALYFQMVEEGVKPDRFTFPRVLKACGGIGLAPVGEAVHRDLVRAGFGYDTFVLNALVDMYAKCGDIVKARSIFDTIACKDSVSWNSMLTGYVRHGLLLEALVIFRLMVQDGIEPDSVAISTVLAGVSLFEYGLQIHGWVQRRGMEWDLSIANALIVFYSRNGHVDRASWLFDGMPERDIVSWNSVISAHNRDARALEYFEQMETGCVMPDSITFVSVLSVCANLGLVEEGKGLFSSMTEKYMIKPRMEHYACMVNLYGRAGLVDEAYSMIVHEMEFEAGATVWGALLYACYVNGNADIGKIAAEHLFELEPDNEHNFELLMKIYSKGGRFEDVEGVRKMMVERGLDT